MSGAEEPQPGVSGGATSAEMDDVASEVTPDVGGQAVFSDTNGNSKRRLSRSRELNESPVVEGKRVRKVNPKFVEEGLAAEGAPPKSPKLKPADGIESLPGAPLVPAAGDGVVPEEIMTPEQAQQKSKRLPKGYAYVPDVPRERNVSLPAKRERKRVSYTDLATGSPVPDPTSPRPSKRRKLNPTSDVDVQTLNDRKKELESKLAELTSTLNSVTQKLEKKTGKKSKKSSAAPVVPNVGYDGGAAGVVPMVEETGLSTATFAPAPVAPKKKSKKKKKKTPAPRKEVVVPAIPEVTMAEPAAHVEPTSPGGTRPARKRKPSLRSSGGGFGEVRLSARMRDCQRLLRTIMSHKFAWPFNEPVDWKALNIPDYPKIITRPMDFGTIKNKIEDGEYDNIFEFENDVQQVFTNATTFNPPGHDICTMSDTLKDIFDKKIAPIREKEVLAKAQSAAFGPTGQLPAAPVMNVLSELRSSINSIKEEVDALRKEKEALQKQRQAELAIPMTKEEKRKLSISINNLPSEHLGMIVEIIQARLPQIVDNQEEIEIDIDALDAVTLRDLESYVNSVKKQQTPKKRVGPVKRQKATPSKGRPVDSPRGGATDQKIADVERRLEELNKLQEITKTAKNAAVAAGAKKPGSDEEVVIDDEPGDKDDTSSESDSDSSSGSDSDSSSDTDSDSDSDSDDDSDNDNAITKDKPTPMAVDEVTNSNGAADDQISFGVSSLDTLGSKPAALTTPSQETLKILPTAASLSKKEVVIQNVDSWSSLASLPDSKATKDKAISSSTEQLWSEFKNKDLELKQREKEKQEKEERLRQEKLRKEEERKKEESRAREALEEEERQRQKYAQEAELRTQRELEERRLAAIRAREQQAKSEESDDSDDDMIMSMSKGMGSNVGLIDLAQLKQKPPSLNGL